MSSLFLKQLDRLAKKLSQLKVLQVRIQMGIHVFERQVPKNICQSLLATTRNSFPKHDDSFEEKLAALIANDKIGSDEYKCVSLEREIYHLEIDNSCWRAYADKLREQLPGIAPIA